MKFSPLRTNKKAPQQTGLFRDKRINLKTLILCKNLCLPAWSRNTSAPRGAKTGPTKYYSGTQDWGYSCSKSPHWGNTKC